MFPKVQKSPRLIQSTRNQDCSCHWELVTVGKRDQGRVWDLGDVLFLF